MTTITTFKMINMPTLKCKFCQLASKTGARTHAASSRWTSSWTASSPSSKTRTGWKNRQSLRSNLVWRSAMARWKESSLACYLPTSAIGRVLINAVWRKRTIWRVRHSWRSWLNRASVESSIIVSVSARRSSKKWSRIAQIARSVTVLASQIATLSVIGSGQTISLTC